MAIFASTTTSGYSDPMKAMSIKALELRQKEMQNQIAAAQQGAITPETTQTPIQGFGHIANILSDNVRQGRADRAVADQRTALAKIRAGVSPEGETPQQIADIGVYSDEAAADAIKRRYDRQALNITEGGLTGRNTADNLSREKINTQTQEAMTGRTGLEVAGRAANVAAEQEGANKRTDSTNLTTLTTNRERIASDAELQAGRFSQEARMAAIQAAIAEEQQKRTFAQQDKQTDKAQGHEKNIVELQSKLKTLEAIRGEEHADKILLQKYAQDEKMVRITSELAAAEKEKDRAANAGEAEKKLAAENIIANLRIASDERQQQIRQSYDAEKQAKDIKSNELIHANQAAATVEAAKVKAAQEAEALKTDPTRIAKQVELEEKAKQERFMVEEMTTVQKDLAEGVYTGRGAGIATAIGQTPFIGEYLGDPEKAARTDRFDRLMTKVATMQMSSILKGSSTDKEMQTFKEVWNSPGATLDQKRTAFARMLRAAKEDQFIGEAALNRMGSSRLVPGGPEAAVAAKEATAKGSAPVDKDTLFKEAQQAINEGADLAEVSKLLEQKGGIPYGLKPKAP